MTDADALYRAVLCDPADDTLRLAYADWLDETAGAVECPRCYGGRKLSSVNREAYTRPPLQPKDLCSVCHGDSLVPDGRAERAEFIRVQVELATIEPKRPRAVPMTPENEVFWQHRENVRTRERELWFTLYGTLASEVNRHMLKARSTADGYSMRWHIHGVSDAREMVTTWSRGFVSHVALPATAFLGGECSNCDGTGELIDPTGPCPCCGGQFEPRDDWTDRGWSPGTGRTPGLAKELFSRHPITRVVLADATVFPSGGNNTYYLGGLGRFPKEYWGRLDGLPSERAVRDAVSAVCVDFGRHEAGLPPLLRPSPATGGTA